MGHMWSVRLHTSSCALPPLGLLPAVIAEDGTKRAAPGRPELAEEQPPTMPDVSSGDAGGEEPPAKKVKTEGSGEERAVKPE